MVEILLTLDVDILHIQCLYEKKSQDLLSDINFPIRIKYVFYCYYTAD